MDLEVDACTSTPGDTVVALTGSLDLASRSEFVEIANTILKTTDCHKLTLDLAGLSFIDSTGIGAIVEVAGMTADQGAAFSLQRPSARVSRILELTGMAELWPIETPPVEP